MREGRAELEFGQGKATSGEGSGFHDIYDRDTTRSRHICWHEKKKKGPRKEEKRKKGGVGWESQRSTPSRIEALHSMGIDTPCSTGLSEQDVGPSSFRGVPGWPGLYGVVYR